MQSLVESYKNIKFGNIKQVDRSRIFPADRIQLYQVPWAYEKQQKKWNLLFQKQKRIVPRGLINNGNMCFMNSILQPLVHCSSFYEFILKCQADSPIIRAMMSFCNEFELGDSSTKGYALQTTETPFQPEYVYDAIRQNTKVDSLKGRQEDAEEFLGYLLDGLHEELLKVNKKSTDIEQEEWNQVGKRKITKTKETSQEPTEISRLFRGKMRSIVKTVKESITVEPFQTLQLEITVQIINQDETIEDCIRAMTAIETLDDFNSSSGHKTTKQTLIEHLPPVLLISLKRFVYDIKQNTTLKVDSHIQFNATLEIPTETLALAKQFHYKLFAVVNHHGKNAQGGHYTCDVLSGDQWLRFDDAEVSIIDAKTVTSRQKDRQAYMLFYVKQE